MRAEVGRGRRGGHGDDVGDETQVVGDVVARDDDRLPDGRVVDEDRLDLAGLDADAADLHLVVRAAEVLDITVGPAAGPVAGPVEPGTARTGRTRTGRERVGHETLAGELGAGVVAARDTGAADEQLAGDANRDRLEPAVQHVRGRIGDGLTDRDGGRARRDRRRRRVDRGLRRAVHVDDTRGRGAILALPGHSRRQRLPRQRDRAHRSRERRRGEHLADDRRHCGDE